MQNTFSQSGNDSKWFSKKSFFRIVMWHSRPPPPFMANTILNFHFDYLITSLISQYQPVKDITEVVPPSELHLDEDFEKLQNKEKAAAAFAAVSKKK